MISMEQIEECFEDHPSFAEIKHTGNVARQIMGSHFMIKGGEEQGFYLPYLMLLGILYCASNKEIRA